MRALWVMAMIAGTIIFALLSAWVFVSIWLRVTEAETTFLLSPYGVGTGIWLLISSGICVGAAFLTPREVKELAKEPETPKAAWLTEYQREREEKRQRGD